MNHSTRFRSTLAAATLACAPLLAIAQTAPAPLDTRPQVARPVEQAATPARTREDVSRQAREAMRDGSWRCMTSNRGWCSTPPSTHGRPTSGDGTK